MKRIRKLLWTWRLRMILERTGDSRWYMKHAGLCGSVDDWWVVLRHYLEGFDE